MLGISLLLLFSSSFCVIIFPPFGFLPLFLTTFSSGGCVSGLVESIITFVSVFISPFLLFLDLHTLRFLTFTPGTTSIIKSVLSILFIPALARAMFFLDLLFLIFFSVTVDAVSSLDGFGKTTSVFIVFFLPLFFFSTITSGFTVLESLLCSGLVLVLVFILNDIYSN